MAVSRSGRRDIAAIVWPLSIASGSMVAQHVAGKATRDTLFLTHFGLALLPAAMIGAAMVSSVSVIGISRALRRFGPARVVPVMFAISATLYLLEWSLSLVSIRGAAIAVYVHSAIFGSAIVSAFWSLVNERFDPHEAKKYVGRIASGGTVGGVVGGLVVWRASSFLSVPMMLALLAGINVVGLWGSLRAAQRDTRVVPVAEPLEESGWNIVKSTPYLRDLALLVLAGAIMQALLDWLLSAHATRELGKGPALLAFFALFNMVVGVLSFALQTLVARRLLEWRGLAAAVKTQPLAVALFTIPALLLGLPLAPIVALRGAEAVVRNSLYRSAYELFYTPLATAKKRATKTIIDVGADRIGTTIGSIALLAIVPLRQELQTPAVLIASLAMAGLSWVVSSRLHDGYVSSLAASLKSGVVALGESDAEDLTTRKTLAETTTLLDRDALLKRIEQFQKDKEERGLLGASGELDVPRSIVPKDLAGDAEVIAGDPLAKRAALLRSGETPKIKAALAAPLETALVTFALPLLANDAVVRDAVRALRRVAPKATGQLLDALLDPDVDARVRRRIPRVLKVCRTQRAASGMLFALKDPLFEVREQVALALAQMAEEADVTLSREAVFDVALHELTAGRTSWQTLPEDENDRLRRGLAHTFTLLGLALEREPLSIAYRAMRSDDPALRGTAFEYLEVVLPTNLRDVVIPLLGDVKPASAGAARGKKELEGELLRSSALLDRSR